MAKLDKEFMELPEQNQDYEPYGKEWQAEMLQLPKTTIIQIFGNKIASLVKEVDSLEANRGIQRAIEIINERDQLKEQVERWIEKYNYDYDRVVPLVKKAAETGDKLISVQDTVIAIGKLMNKVADLEQKNADLELALKNL